MSSAMSRRESEATLRQLYRQPGDLVRQKVLDRLDDHARTFIAAAPFVLLGTANANGTADVSPKGGPPGFVVVLDDEHLAIPDLAGNNLLDSITNVVNGSGIGLLFLVPGIDETLRVNGEACLTTDPTVLDACAVKDRRPKAAIGVTVVEQFMHCAKAFRRSELWQPESWPGRDAVPPSAASSGTRSRPPAAWRRRPSTPPSRATTRRRSGSRAARPDAARGERASIGPMRILVLGGNRYIGLALVGELARCGHEVTVLNSHEVPLPDGVMRLHGDRQQPGVLREVLADRRDDFDVVFDNTAYHVKDLEPDRRALHRPHPAAGVHQLVGGVPAQLRPAGPGDVPHPRPPRRRRPQGLRRRQGAVRAVPARPVGAHRPADDEPPGRAHARSAQPAGLARPVFFARLEQGRPIFVPGEGFSVGPPRPRRRRGPADGVGGRQPADRRADLQRRRRRGDEHHRRGPAHGPGRRCGAEHRARPDGHRQGSHAAVGPLGRGPHRRHDVLDRQGVRATSTGRRSSGSRTATGTPTSGSRPAAATATSSTSPATTRCSRPSSDRPVPPRR